MTDSLTDHCEPDVGEARLGEEELTWAPGGNYTQLPGGPGLWGLICIENNDSFNRNHPPPLCLGRRFPSSTAT